MKYTFSLNNISFRSEEFSAELKDMQVSVEFSAEELPVVCKSVLDLRVAAKEAVVELIPPIKAALVEIGTLIYAENQRQHERFIERSKIEAQ